MTPGFPDADPTVAVFSAIIVKQGTTWQIDSAEESPLPQPTAAAEALRELEWLEGSWLDESGDTRIISTFRWSPTRTFLIRSISAETSGSKTDATAIGHLKCANSAVIDQWLTRWVLVGHRVEIDVFRCGINGGIYDIEECRSEVVSPISIGIPVHGEIYRAVAGWIVEHACVAGERR